MELIAHATLHIAHGFNVNKLKFSPEGEIHILVCYRLSINARTCAKHSNSVPEKVEATIQKESLMRFD